MNDIIASGLLLVAIINIGLGMPSLSVTETANNVTMTREAYLERFRSSYPGAFQKQSTTARNTSFITPIHKLNDGETQVKAVVPPIKYTIGNLVLTGPMKVHILYYGSWTSNQKSIIETFISNIGSSPWFNIEKTYYYQASTSSAKKYISGPVSLGTRITDNYSRGSYIYGTMIQDRFKYYIQQQKLPNDPTAAYLFLSSADVYERIRDDVGPGYFCYNYCGYHLSFTIGSKRYFYGMVGNPKYCIGGCTSFNRYVSPNGDVGVDAMLSAIGHELVELMSDPVSDVRNLRAWQDSIGNENADKCTSTYGSVLTLSNGAKYNIALQSKKYLIQQNWDAKKQQCAMTA